MNHPGAPRQLLRLKNCNSVRSGRNKQPINPAPSASQLRRQHPTLAWQYLVQALSRFVEENAKPANTDVAQGLASRRFAPSNQWRLFDFPLQDANELRQTRSTEIRLHPNWRAATHRAVYRRTKFPGSNSQLVAPSLSRILIRVIPYSTPPAPRPYPSPLHQCARLCASARG